MFAVRAGEYAAASAVYAQLTKESPDYAPFLGLWAECLLQTGKVAEAVEAWNRSESASNGTLTQFESLVCEVNGRIFSDRKREELLVAVRKGDLQAAERLIDLDCKFPLDWWNSPLRQSYLEHDLAVLGEVKFADMRRRDEIICGGKAMLAAEENPKDVRKVLRPHGFLFDDAATLPNSSSALARMLGAVELAKVQSIEDSRAKWGAEILRRTEKSRDAELHNVAAYLYVKTDRIAEIHSLGWEATKDERFAVGLLLGLEQRDKLSVDDKRLAEAIQLFPKNAMLAGVAVRLAEKSKQPLQPVIIRAIQAEYAGFSLNTTSFPRPGARALRKYFALLAKELAAKGGG